MTQVDIPADLRRFILTSIPSVPYLEAVLLMRADPAHEWTAADIARRLYLPEQRAAELLEQLASAGIADPGPAGGCLYRPAAPELGEMLDRLAAQYAADLVGISGLIHSTVDKKARQFADAFRWRKDA